MQIKTLVLAFLSLPLSISFAFAQQPAKEYLFEVRGWVVDTEQVPYGAMHLTFEGDNFKDSALSDENGKFSVKLPEGKYRVHVLETTSATFNAFIEISKSGLNPTDFVLVIEFNQNWCANCPAGKMPAVVKYVVPKYPFVALAVGAAGEIVVAVTLDSEGKVTSAKAINGHPLLKKTAESSVLQWVFSPDNNLSTREGKITFAFTSASKDEIKNRFRQPNRMEIFYYSTIY